jgi:hypothetical protein
MYNKNRQKILLPWPRKNGQERTQLHSFGVLVFPQTQQEVVAIADTDNTAASGLNRSVGRDCVGALHLPIVLMSQTSFDVT